MELWQVLSFQVKVDLGVMATKWYSHSQEDAVQCHTQDTSLRRSYFSVEDIVDVW